MSSFVNPAVYNFDISYLVLVIVFLVLLWFLSLQIKYQAMVIEKDLKVRITKQKYEKYQAKDRSIDWKVRLPVNIKQKTKVLKLGSICF